MTAHHIKIENKDQSLGHVWLVHLLVVILEFDIEESEDGRPVI